ncbi:MAG: transposase [Planctomycetes bacterium]|nr:transposase [Planctomycetota bacterium]
MPGHRTDRSPALDHSAEGRRPASKKNAAHALLDQTLALASQAGLLGDRAPLTAVDGSGFEAHHVSHYFVRRRSRGADKHLQSMTYRRFPKVGILADCRTHLILAAVPGRGPGPDHFHFKQILREALARRSLGTVAADAGYDAEWVHRHARDDHGLVTLIPPLIGRPTDKPPSTPYRRQMRTYFKRPPERRQYGQRWQVETVISMIKRRLGETLNTHSFHRQNRSLHLKVITHNLMIVRRVVVFYRAGQG